jgi:hypothetical protein
MDREAREEREEVGPRDPTRDAARCWITDNEEGTLEHTLTLKEHHMFTQCNDDLCQGCSFSVISVP